MKFSQGVKLFKHIETPDIDSYGGPDQAARVQLVNISDLGVSAIDSGSAADGDVLTADGTGGVAFEAVTAAIIDSGAATDGQVLTADGAGGASWQAPAAPSLGYVEYFAILNQSGVNPPTATRTLINTTGTTVSFSYEDVGKYGITFSPGNIITIKTICPNMSSIYLGQIGYLYSPINVIRVYIPSDPYYPTNVIYVEISGGDNKLSDFPFWIRIYD